MTTAVHSDIGSFDSLSCQEIRIIAYIRGQLTTINGRKTKTDTTNYA